MEQFHLKNLCVPYPQEDKAIKIKDFRPIDLITSVYKIIAKVLANDLKKVPYQTFLSR